MDNESLKQGKPDERGALGAVTLGRDGRAAAQSALLRGRGGCFVCQITLNIPGFPKRLPGDAALIELCSADFRWKVCREPVEEVQLANGAGLALLLLFEGGRAEMAEAKRAGLDIEENNGYGRVVDIDIITADGAMSRRDFHLRPRRCFLCGEDSKECARERRHSYEELRRAARGLIEKITEKRD